MFLCLVLTAAYPAAPEGPRTYAGKPRPRYVQEPRKPSKRSRGAGNRAGESDYHVIPEAKVVWVRHGMGAPTAFRTR